MFFIFILPSPNCSVAGLDTGDSVSKEQDEGCEDSNSFRSLVSSDITISPASPTSPPESHSQRNPQDEKTKSHLNRNRTKRRVKSSSRRLFLDSSLSDKEEADDTEKTESGGKPNAFSKKNGSGHQCKEGENRGNEYLAAEQDSCENSWTCPLTSDDLPPSPSDTEIEEPSSLRPVCHAPGLSQFQLSSKSCSGVILKLRRMFSKGVNRKKACSKVASDSFTDPTLSQTEDGEGKRNSKGDFYTRTPKVIHRWQRTGSFSYALRPLKSTSKRKHSSLLKIKYCPYLSACHSAEHRRRWVLRSAVQRAQRAMRFYYPDLVGKRILHLYEEDDKSEVWYRGEVLRIHETHTNPLQTIFEVRYDSEPEWKYYLELLIDFKKGWLKIED